MPGHFCHMEAPHKKLRLPEWYVSSITWSKDGPAKGASGSGAPPGERNGQYRHGERTKAAIAKRQRFSALLKMLRAGLR